MITDEIKPNIWRNAYYFWASERGTPTYVKPIRYINLRGWNNYIQKITHDNRIWCGETWLCEDIFGDELECTFRIPYSEEMEENKEQYRFKKTYNYIGEPLVEINAHFDGFDAYINNNIKLRNNMLLKKVNEKQKDKITNLKKWFKELNNIENRLLKLGIQLYLRRLETPTLQTRREWAEYGTNHPYLKSQIIDFNREKNTHYNRSID